MKHFISTVFKGVSPSYIGKQYLSGLVLYIVILRFQPINISFPLLTLSLILYPFAMVVYDSIMDLLIGDTTFISSVFFVAIFKIIRTIIIFSCSILIAPFGILYLYFTGRNTN